MKTAALLQGLAATSIVSAQKYVWPNKQDSLEDLLYLQNGYIRNGALSDQVMTCDFGAGQPGIQKSAEWVRTNFHDAATHDAVAKTGGLDASIIYELERQENLGDALNNTLSDISSSVDVHSSAADVLALSLVMAVARCGDLRVPFRMGRVDATQAGPKGVPEAHTDLETTRKRFQIAGFNQTEMITLVACGHTLGGVHSVDHPEIVTSGTPSPENVARFDTTTGSFDNAVVLEYLKNTTANPLVRARNNTLNSDRRIFSADGNATMTRLRDPAVFKAQCESLFTRMINLVPGNVSLSPPLQPADVKPYIVSNVLLSNGSVKLTGRVRVRTSADTGRNPDTLTVSLLPTYADGSAGSPISAQRATLKGGSTSGYLRETFHWWEFSAVLPGKKAVKTFNIKLGSEVRDNAGTGGYPLSADVLYLNQQSCLTYDDATQTGKLRVVAAVRKTAIKGGEVPTLDVVQKTRIQRSFIPRLQVQNVQMKAVGKEVGEWALYQGQAVLGRDGLGTTFDVGLKGKKVEFLGTGELLDHACAAF